jgi:glucosamine--fructose-6-phosphate aminotransferase (isomerizing)
MQQTSSFSTNRSKSNECSSEVRTVSLPETPPPEVGAQYLSEIREQPAALLRLLDHEAEFARVAKTIIERDAHLIRFVGHGSSDNAASYGVYAFGLIPRWTALRDSITLTVYYDSGPELAGSTVIGLSQSGRTPDVVEYVGRARAAGAFTVALTNDVGSDLARVAEAVLPLSAGVEHAVAATKTYTTQVAALALLAGHAAGQGAHYADGIREVAGLLDAAMPELERRAIGLAVPFSYVGRMFVIGRGPEFATARETALKLLETCRVAAEPLTATDLAHGPVAALDSLFPVWAIASADATLPTVTEAAERIRAAGATLVSTGTAASAIEGADYVLPVPEPSVPLLAPVLSVLPGQLFALGLARAKGLDPDQPRGLSKVTLAR